MKAVTRDRLRDDMFYIIKTKRMYRSNDYTVRMLAKDLNTNLRYVSLVLNECYGMNYKTFVNKFRVEDAMAMLGDKEYDDVNIEDIGSAVGFLNKQSFFTYFTRIAGMTPLKFRKMMKVKNGQ